MPRVPFVLVDVFAERPLEGNQLCVLPESPGLDAALVQALASEIGFSETTWVMEVAPDRYRMRIFTPATEIPFAGHPSLGTAYVLAALGRTGSEVTQRVPAGEYPLVVDLEAGRARMGQGTAAFGAAFEDRELLAGALGLAPDQVDASLPARPVSTGFRHLMVPLVDAAAVRAARPDVNRLHEVSERTGCGAVYLFAVEAPGRAVARLFASEVGILEDPATGSAAGPLGAYLYANGRVERELEIDQGRQVGRPSRLLAEVEGPREAPIVWVAGGVHLVGEGTFDVPSRP